MLWCFLLGPRAWQACVALWSLFEGCSLPVLPPSRLAGTLLSRRLRVVIFSAKLSWISCSNPRESVWKGQSYKQAPKSREIYTTLEMKIRWSRSRSRRTHRIELACATCEQRKTRRQASFATCFEQSAQLPYVSACSCMVLQSANRCPPHVQHPAKQACRHGLRFLNHLTRLQPGEIPYLLMPAAH